MPKNDSLKGYGGPPTGGKPGEVEAWALMQAAFRMKDAVDSGDSDRIMESVRLNWRMWTLFQAELLDPECTVPTEIRVDLLSLANFIDKHTVAFFVKSKPESLDILISINRNLATGLYATPPVESAAAAGEPAETGEEAPPAVQTTVQGEGDATEDGKGLKGDPSIKISV